MYKHLMVPVDDTALSAANVDAAVQLARRLGARLSFFHATADLGATGEGELLRTIAPEQFREEAVGETHAVLAKAAASAAAAGVPCQTLCRTSDRPAEAIVQAASAQHCDLIVMASRGVRRGVGGWLHTSQTERVLRDSPVALLVTRVALNDPPTAAERALAVILDEHRSIAAVVRGLQELAAQRPLVDTAGVRTLLEYLQDFPLRMHHPKEETYLHRHLRQRCTETEALLQTLEQQHRSEHLLVAQALASVRALRPGDAPATEHLAQQIGTLADAVWQHLSLEERTVLPLARQHLLAEDWAEMALAFEGHDEPAFGDLPAGEFRKLFTRIANLVGSARNSGQ